MSVNEKPIRETKGFWRKLCIIPGRLVGKIAIVTGANTGIGKMTAAELARRGCHVIMACRNKERAESAKKWILDTYGVGNPDYLKTNLADPCLTSSLTAVTSDQLQIEILDLASLKSVREFATRIVQQHEYLNYLINNAGLAMEEHCTTEDGYEQTIAVNHLGPFLLTELLVPLLRKGVPSRIIMVSSTAHWYGELRKPDLQTAPEEYGLVSAYAQSKLANLIHARELAKRLSGSGVIPVSLHPGAVRTELFRDARTIMSRMMRSLFLRFTITPWLGCQTTLYTVLTPNLTPGAYYDNCKETSPASKALNDADGEWLWNKSCELVGLTQEVVTDSKCEKN
ncbi:retinol dehydrogenase 12 [Clonorchis sinensis]|uniref:Retinol dehydrogenase 12 n=1 Tax=Clonorchis sinensis TaxID=79923 RepID=H2KUA6_CLOSI|nr:retinol dehydrogenase 12 [Clonorchis sinensis]